MEERYISFCGEHCIGEQTRLDPALAKDDAINYILDNPESGNVTMVFKTDEDSGLAKPGFDKVYSVHIRFSPTEVSTFDFAQVNHA